jgi:hypothetical protein
MVQMARLTLLKTSEDADCSHDLVRLVWKHFESEICETLRQLTEELGEQGEAESDVREGQDDE